MIGTSTSTESAERFEPVVTFDDETVKIDFTRQLAVNMSRDEFDLFTFAIRTGYSEHLDALAETDAYIDQRWPEAAPATQAETDPFALGGLASLVFGP